jgi:aldose 1-epimerase
VHELSRNDGTTSMHGGDVGFDQKLWSADTFEERGACGVRLQSTSPDGEMGFPGTLHAVATYRLEAPGRLTLELQATADAPTVCNLTNHSYWNLGGESAGSALGQLLEIAAEQYLPVDADLVPAGRPAGVAGTPFDFRRAEQISARIREGDEQLVLGRGYDHCFVLGGPSRRPRQAARLHDPGSGRTLRLFTTQPGLQLYSGNFLDGTVRGTSGHLYRQGDGVALEPQHLPDSPNRQDFPSSVLRPGERYEETIVFELSVES